MPSRILFVDDEPRVLEKLQRELAPLSGDWDLRFACGGPAAIQSLAERPAEVVVTDLQMPGMDGQILLGEVRRRYPEAVRIALMQQGSGENAHRAIAVAHRLLSKSCETQFLVDTIARSLALRSTFHHPGLARAIGRAGSIPSLSSVYSELSDALERPDCSTACVASIIGRDLGMASKLLQVANSAAFGTRSQVIELGDAVRRIGTATTRNLVLATAVFSRYDPTALAPYSIDELWSHSLAVSALARKLARRERLPEAQTTEAAIGGLMHDVGRLILAAVAPAEYRSALGRVRLGESLVDAEREAFGVSHAEVGGYLLDLWGLPSAIVEAVAWHHSPASCPDTGITPVAAVHAADALLGSDEASFCEEYLESSGLIDRVADWEAIRDENAVAAR